MLVLGVTLNELTRFYTHTETHTHKQHNNNNISYFKRCNEVIVTAVLLRQK